MPHHNNIVARALKIELDDIARGGNRIRIRGKRRLGPETRSVARSAMGDHERRGTERKRGKAVRQKGKHEKESSRTDGPSRRRKPCRRFV